MFCNNNICMTEPKCLSDLDCSDDESCSEDNVGRKECKKVCNARFLCGRNSECVARLHSGECQCKSGYYYDGNHCRKIECNSDQECSLEKKCDNHICKNVCLVNQCGTNSICVADNHQQLCQCLPGYSGDAHVQCDEVNYCESNPCAPGAFCENSHGSFSCFCKEADMVGDPYTVGCQKAVECQINDHCPKSAKCIHDKNGVPKCRDACEDVQCGRNSECFAENHVGLCRCRSGYEGNPNRNNGCKPIKTSCKSTLDCPTNSYCSGGTCKSTCSSSEEDCQSSEVCAGGQCVNLCDHEASPCGMNAECKMFSHAKCKSTKL